MYSSVAGPICIVCIIMNTSHSHIYVVSASLDVTFKFIPINCHLLREF